jgi:hypothetical protein
MAKKFLKGLLTIALLILLIASLGGCDSDSLDGTWFDGVNSVYVFSGSNVTYRWSSTENQGTFSISGSQIEFVWDNERIVVFPFSRTDNTVAIGTRRYYRQ